MVDEIHVHEIKEPTTAELEFEIVERKGLGHPDTNSSGSCFTCGFLF
jgi:S-adenosylmethionine synthetase